MNWLTVTVRQSTVCGYGEGHFREHCSPSVFIKHNNNCISLQLLSVMKTGQICIAHQTPLLFTDIRPGEERTSLPDKLGHLEHQTPWLLYLSPVSGCPRGHSPHQSANLGNRVQSQWGFLLCSLEWVKFSGHVVSSTAESSLVLTWKWGQNHL